MKILRIVSSGFQEGGAENGIVLIQPILEGRGHTIKILSSDARSDMPHFNHYSFRSPYGIFAKLMYTFNISAYRTLKQVLKEFKPDIVNLHTLGAASPLVLFALRNYLTVATVHGPEVYTKDLLMWCLPKSDFIHGEYDLRKLSLVGKMRYLYYRYVNYPLYRLGFRNIDCFITISAYIHKLMESQGVISAYIPNGIGMLPYKPLTKDGVNHKIVFAGRLEKYKGVEYLLRALPPVISQFTDAMLYIAGSGRDNDDLKALAKTLGIDKHVLFLGNLGREALRDVYTQGSVVVVPSIWPETCSRVGIEAMSVGRPVVASDVGGMPEWLIDGKVGYIVPPQNASAISDAIQKLFNDETALVAMGKNARIKAEEYDINLHAKRVEELYAKMMAKGKRKRGESFAEYLTNLEKD